MTRVLGLTILAAALAVPAASVRADWVIGDWVDYTSRTGGFNSPGVFSDDVYGYVYGPVGPAIGMSPSAGRGYFGAQWDGPVEVYTLELTQFADTGTDRKRPWVLHAYTGPTTYVEIELAYTQDWQKLDFVELLGGPILASNSYLVLAVQSMHDGNADTNFGVITYNFTAKAVGEADVNYNVLPGVTASMNNPLIHAPEKTIDGQIAAVGTGTSPYWTRNAAAERDMLKVTYDPANLPETVGSIGLGFAGDAHTRDLPKWVDIGDGTRTERIYISEVSTQYCRYELSAPFLSPAYLTVTMPPADGTSADAANWWIFNDANYGITEFQAFATAIPEPVTMTLLTLGGLTLLRRRR